MLVESKTLFLWYAPNDTWFSLDMAMQDGSWTAIIPGQSGGITVKFFVEAFDNEENKAKTSIFDYIVIVPNQKPIALFTESASTVYTNESIHFDASGSYDPDGSIVVYYWDIGDGNITTGMTSNHTYSEAGNYTVMLTVTDIDGASTENAMKIVETEESLNGVLSLSFLAAIGLVVAALTFTLIYGLLIRRKKKRAET
jgi:PKD repeat protein